MANFKNTKINDTGHVSLPTGDTASRPASPQNGMLRYNTDFDVVECYRDGKWISMESGVELFYEDFSGTSLDTDKWVVTGSSYGNVTVANGECTLVNTGTTNQYFGIRSKIQVPLGATLEVRVKNTQARHAAVISLQNGPVFLPFPHTSSNAGYPGISWYSRADNVSSTVSVRDELDETIAYSPAAQDLRNYSVFKIKRDIAKYGQEGTYIQFYKDNDFPEIPTFYGVRFEEDYFISFASDGWGNTNLGGLDTITVIDYVKVY